jgi:hypothetical protein
MTKIKNSMTSIVLSSLKNNSPKKSLVTKPVYLLKSSWKLKKKVKDDTKKLWKSINNGFIHFFESPS